MATNIFKLTNANLYIDGANTLGVVEEFDVPAPESIQQEHKALGLIGNMEFPTGFEKLEARLKWTCIDTTYASKMFNIFTTCNLQLRANLETWDSNGRAEQRSYVVFMQAMPKNIPTGNFKPRENTEFETMLNVQYIKLEIDGELIYEFDPKANIYQIKDVDALGTYRANLGL
jgi:hypothetical protein